MLIFDCETGPLPTHELLALCPPFEAPPHPGEFDPSTVKYGVTKDPAKRAEKLKSEEEKHAAAVRSYTQDVEAARRDHFAKFCERAALDPTTGRVLAIGFLAADKPDKKVVTDDDADEGSLINRFWMQYSRCRQSNRRMVGLNIYGFDLPFLIRRSWILNVPVPLTVFDGRYFDRLFIDIQQVWLCGQRWSGNGCESSLAAIARAFGVGEKNGSGADFARLLAEDREAALRYLRNDLELTAKCAARMGVA